MNDGYMPVKVMVPLDLYRDLYQTAQRRNTTVAALIARKLARTGRPSGYTPEAGARIAAEREINRSFAEIGRDLGINHATAHEWLTKYENEKRERAGSRA